MRELDLGHEIVKRGTSAGGYQSTPDREKPFDILPLSCLSLLINPDQLALAHRLC